MGAKMPSDATATTKNLSLSEAASLPATIYCHWESFTQAFTLDQASCHASVGALRRVFLEACEREGHHQLADNKTTHFITTEGYPLVDKTPLALALLTTEVSGRSTASVDLFLKDGEGSGLRVLAKSENSYYYAHTSLSTKHVPDAWRPEKLDAEKTKLAHNKRQSPFGTDIEKYESIQRYSFEDHSDTVVKVFIPLEGVGKLDPSQVTSSFGDRQFEVLIHGYDGGKRNLRLGCSKTHAEINIAESKHAIRANKITLQIRKKKDGEVWFDLFKKKAIGDNDDP